MATKKTGRQLSRTVTVVNPEDGNDYTFSPDDPDGLPSWAESAITNPAAFESEDDFLADDGSFDGARRDAELNKRGRVQRGVPMSNGMGEKNVPENAQAATSKDAGKPDGK